MTNKKEYSRAEVACSEMYDHIDETFSSLVVLKNYLNSDDYSKYHANHMIDGLIKSMINAQTDMMQQADLEF